MIKTLTIAFTLLMCCSSAFAESPIDERPNILWITIEDWSPDLSCYGTKGIATPHVDKLASEGVRYQWAFTTSPVCSTSRSAMMTGFHQNYIGAHQHRTTNKKPLPHNIKPIPHLLKEAGYFTALMSYKLDVNFLPDTRHELFEGTDWKQRKEGQPFFARITFPGTHRKWERDPQRPIKIEDVELPPYYADTPFCRRDWANGLEQMQIVDRKVGKILKRLEDEGLTENTIVFFIGDHGRCHIRGKQFLYDGGIRVPMIMRWPGKVEAGSVNEDLTSSIDICSTVLEAAGVTAPVPLHGTSLLSDDLKDRKYIFAARDKMDNAHDSMRTIRSKDYKLIVNLMPERPWLQFSRYKEQCYPMLAEMGAMYQRGELTPAQAVFFASSKPEIELFDLKKDPFEINNVADEPAYADTKAELLAALTDWRENVIMDEGVDDEFRAVGQFDESQRGDLSMDQWVLKNRDQLDFNRYGWPGWYPTRSQQQWEEAVETWKPYVFRGPTEDVQRPSVAHAPKQKAKPAKKKKSGAKKAG
ncbi:sulfatase family protein [Mariniblastus fucicola]